MTQKIADTVNLKKDSSLPDVDLCLNLKDTILANSK